VTPWSVLIVGFLVGIRHATDADHVAAVATLATQQHSVWQTVRQGLAWGIGHAVVLIGVGGAVLAFGEAVPNEVAHGLELAVGLMLLLLGVDLCRRIARPPQRRGSTLTVAHHAALPPGARSFPLRACAIGMMHGLAGTASIVLLSIATTPSVVIGLLHIAIFGVGSILGMTILSFAIALPLRLSAQTSVWWRNGVSATVGATSCALGLLIVYRIGFVERLFGAAAAPF
jgi:high-affinity nickel-transport protein